MSHKLFNDSERELIDAARLILSDGLRRLSSREGLFPTTLTRGRAARADITAARGAMIDYLVATYGPLRHEVAAVALVDAQGRLIAVKEFPQGKATSCEMAPRLLAQFVIESGATAVLLVHNHPSGDNTPSQQDERLTAAFEGWLSFMGVELIDHVVVSVDGAASIKGAF